MSSSSLLSSMVMGFSAPFPAFESLLLLAYERPGLNGVVRGVWDVRMRACIVLGGVKARNNDDSDGLPSSSEDHVGSLRKLARWTALVPVALVPVALVPVALVPMALVPMALVPVALVPVALVPVALVRGGVFSSK